MKFEIARVFIYNAQKCKPLLSLSAISDVISGTDFYICKFLSIFSMLLFIVAQ